MRLKSEDISKISFPIKRHPIYNEMNHDTKHDCIYRTDTGATLGVVSRDYKLVPHKIAIETVLNKLSKANLPEITPVRISTSALGARLYASFRFAQEFDLGIKSTEDMKKGDIIAPGFNIFNSYDRSLQYSISTFLVRLACTNGMTITEQFFSDSKRHTRSLEIEPMVDSFVENYSMFGDRVLPAIKRMSDKEVTPSSMENQLNGLPDWYRKEAVSYLRDHNLVGVEETEGGLQLVMMRKVTEWDFYNSLTFVLSHFDKVSEERRKDLSLEVSANFGF